jgi:elongation factor Ts
MVQELRSKSGAGLMECKKALEATSGDLEAAFDHLRKAGLKTAAKKAGRIMGEGLVAADVAPDGSSGSMVALTCETDFVAKTDDFKALLAGICALARQKRIRDPEELSLASYQGSTVDDAIKQLSGRLGENMGIGNVATFTSESGRVGAYIHHNGKVGVLCSVSGKAAQPAMEAFLKDLGMHVAALRPFYVRRADVPEQEIAREKAIYQEEVRGKPADIQEKILMGKLSSFFASTVLLEQPWVREDSVTVQQALARALGPQAQIEAFTRFQVGT